MPLYTLEGIAAQSNATGVPIAVIQDLYNVVNSPCRAHAAGN